MLNREEKKIKLTVVSPVFIGGAESLNKSQYVLQEDQHRVCIVDEEKLADLLLRKGHWDDFVQEMGRTGFELRKFLGSYQLLDALGELCRYTIPCPADTTKLNDINPFIKDYLFRPYIPGSSLKGSLRTAMTVGLIKQPEFAASAREMWNRSLGILRNMEIDSQAMPDERGRRDIRKKAWKDVSNLIDEKIDRLFHKFPLKLDEFKNVCHDSVNDCLRGFRISDSQPLSPANLCLLQKADAILGADSVNTKGVNTNGVINPIPTFRECLTPGSEIGVTITLDLDFLQHLGIHSFGDVCRLLAPQKDFLLAWRSQATQTLPPLPGGSLLALGGGVGFPAKSVLYALAPDEASARWMVSKLLAHQFPQAQHLEQDRQASPRTVKLARWEDSWYDMGWVKLEEAPE